MTQLLEAEDEDDFYKTTYGGFEEEAEDIDYGSEESDSESTDSDFSIDENDDVHSDVDDDDEPKRKKRVVTKAYKEPKKDAPQEKKKSEVKRREKIKEEIPAVQIYQSPERKSLRRSTAIKSRETQSRQKRREATAQILKDIALKKNVKVEDVRRLTQEELLAEAKVTEQINVKSLETYQKLELEKKRSRVTKQVYRGPIVRYHSVTMPLLSEDACTEPDITVDEDGDMQQDAEQPSSSELCSRTFITFTDDKVFHEVFPSRRRKLPQKLMCPVTRLPAKYLDPVTNTPYATAQAFRLIREAYAKQLEEEQNKLDTSAAAGTPTQTKKRERVQSGVTVAE